MSAAYNAWVIEQEDPQLFECERRRVLPKIEGFPRIPVVYWFEEDKVDIERERREDEYLRKHGVL